MDMRDIKDKPIISSVQRKKLETEAEALAKKEFLLAYNAFAAVANALESEKTRQAARTFRMARTAGLPKHLDRAIQNAESWDDRDKLCRRLASQCYKTAQWFMKSGDYKQGTKWMNLVLRFLRLSMDPKAKEDVDRVEKELAELKTQMSQLEGKQGEQDDGEDTEG